MSINTQRSRHDLISRLASFFTNEADTEALQAAFYLVQYEILEDMTDEELEQFALGIWGA